MTSSSNAFPKHIEQILDSYKVLSLPDGFTDRLLQKAMSKGHLNNEAQKTSAWTRGRKNNPWRRGGYIASGFMGFGLVSAAAAAALSLAEIPVKIPIMTDLVERVLPQASAKADPPQRELVTARPEQTMESDMELLDNPSFSQRKLWRDMESSEKRQVLKARVEKNEAKIQERRARRGLPPLTDTQLRKRRLAVRRALAIPETRRPLVRRAMRRAAVDRKAAENNLPLMDPHTKAPLSDPRNSKDGVQDTHSQSVASEVSAEPPIEDAQASELQETHEKNEIENVDNDVSDVGLLTQTPRLTPEQRQILQEKLPAVTKAKLRQATPAERQRLLRKLRSKRKDLRSRRQARQRLRDIRNRAK